MSERTDFYSHQKAEFFANFGLEKFSFPELNLADQMLPDLAKEIIWIRQHIEEGSLDKTTLTQRAHTVYIDTRPCPPFLHPYENENHFLGELIARLREAGKIPQTFDDWGKDAVELVLPKTSRFGISIPEIEELVIPAVKQQLSLDFSTVRLPTPCELLYLRSRMKIFSDLTPEDGSSQTKEWTNNHYLSTEGKKLGHIYISGRNDKYKSSGVHWWFIEGEINRLPTLGFRLVIEPANN